MGKWLYITPNHGHLQFTLFLPSSPLTAGRAEKPACSLARVVVGKSFQLHWPEDAQLFFPSLHVLLEKLRHNATHYVHSEIRRNVLVHYSSFPTAMEINTTVYNWVQFHTSHSKTHTDLTVLHERTSWLSFQQHSFPNLSFDEVSSEKGISNIVKATVC